MDTSYRILQLVGTEKEVAFFEPGDSGMQSESESESCSVVFNSLWPHGLHNPWNSPGQNTGVDSLSLLQGIFSTQESNSGLSHYRRILYQLSHKGSPRILEWVAYLFCSGSSQPRNWTEVSCIAGRFFTSWATRDAKEWSNPNHFLELLCLPS